MNNINVCDYYKASIIIESMIIPIFNIKTLIEVCLFDILS